MIGSGKKVMAVASYGGHWKQLLRLKSVFENYDVAYVTTNSKEKLQGRGRVYSVSDANKDSKLKMLLMIFQSFCVFLIVRPDVVVTTGAAPGLIMVLFAKLFGKKSIWIDSVANAEELSYSGKLAKKYASVMLSQWKDVAEKEGVLYKGGGSGLRIFVSVGTQLSFDRLVESVENLAIKNGWKVDFQVAGSKFKSSLGVTRDFVNPDEYAEFFEKCDLFVSHAGVGSIITALDNGKSIVVLPRRFEYGEHRNDHQMATAKKFERLSNVFVAWSEAELEKNIKLAFQSKSAEVCPDKVDRSLIDFLEKELGK